MAKTENPKTWGMAICKGCRAVFLRVAGTAGVYCSRACYENPLRPNRSQTVPKQRDKAGRL